MPKSELTAAGARSALAGWLQATTEATKYVGLLGAGARELGGFNYGRVAVGADAWAPEAGRMQTEIRFGPALVRPWYIYGVALYPRPRGPGALARLLFASPVLVAAGRVYRYTLQVQAD